MANATELTELFAAPGGSLTPDVQNELESIIRIHATTPQELFYKWESYNLKMRGAEDLKLSLSTVRDFKKDMQDSMGRQAAERRTVGATPRAMRSAGGAGGGAFDMMEGIIAGGTPAASTGHKSTVFATPSRPSKSSSSLQIQTPRQPFQERQNIGEIIESLNGHLSPTAPTEIPQQARIKLTANTELSKFAYKPMAMKLSAASEILDDRIDLFAELIHEHYNLDDGAFGNPASQSPSEIIAVGRVASESPDAKLNSASIVLETSRRTGAGLRVRLDLSDLKSYDLFPGKIVAVRGSNASGELFKVSEILETPLLPPAASSKSELEIVAARLGQDETSVNPALSIVTSAGPYTADDNLSFEPLQALCARAKDTKADALILAGPFLDQEHPLVAIGDFPPLPASISASEDQLNLADVFRGLIGLPLEQLARAVPSITIILVPSIRDVISKHAAWPQDRVPKKGLGLPKQCFVVTNPITISLNEVVFAISSQDVLYELKRESCTKQAADSKPVLERLSRSLIEQRHFFPLYPSSSRDNLPKPADVDGVADLKATGASLDVSYLALGEWQNRRPDVLITPSSLAPFAKVVDSIIVINPGAASRKRAPGTFAQIFVSPRDIGSTIEDDISHNVFDRARVDVMKL